MKMSLHSSIAWQSCGLCNGHSFEYPDRFLEEYFQRYGDMLESFGEPRVTCRKLESIEEVLKEADVSSQPKRYSCLSKLHACASCPVIQWA